MDIYICVYMEDGSIERKIFCLVPKRFEEAVPGALTCTHFFYPHNNPFKIYIERDEKAKPCSNFF